MAVTGKPASAASPSVAASHRLLVFSSNDEHSLQQAATKVQAYVHKHPERLPEVASSLAQKRDHESCRAFAVVEEGNDTDTALAVSEPVSRSSSAPKPEINFVFTGQGAQSPQMALGLLQSYPSFRDDIKRMDKVLQTLPHPPLWTIEEEMMRSPAKSRIATPELSYPVCVALQIGLVKLLAAWNIKPRAVVGHSSGEIAAAYATGALTLEEAISVAYYSGHVTQHFCVAGAMAAVGLGAPKVQSYLSEGVGVACDNSPSSSTISGDQDKVDAIVARVKADHPDLIARRLRVERAFHSHHVRKVGGQYEALLRDLGGNLGESKAPSVPFFSTVTRAKIEHKGELGAAYWRSNLEQPVLFSQAVGQMLETAEGDSICLEIGPHSALETAIEEIVEAAGREETTTYISTLERGMHGVQALLTTLGRLFQERIDVWFPNDSKMSPLEDLAV